jgi:hypothetical protein
MVASAAKVILRKAKPRSHRFIHERVIASEAKQSRAEERTPIEIASSRRSSQ